MAWTIETVRHYVSQGFKVFRITLYYAYIPAIILFGLVQSQQVVEGPNPVTFVPSLRDIILPGPTPEEKIATAIDRAKKQPAE